MLSKKFNKKKVRNQSYAVGTNNLKQSSFLTKFWNPPFYPPMMHSYAKGGEIVDNSSHRYSIEAINHLDQSYYFRK